MTRSGKVVEGPSEEDFSKEEEDKRQFEEEKPESEPEEKKETTPRKRKKIDIELEEATRITPEKFKNAPFPQRLIGDVHVGKALSDLGASINLMPLSIMNKLGIKGVQPTMMSLQLADRSIKHPFGMVEVLLVKVDKLIFPTDLVVLDMEVDKEIPLILGRPFLATGRAVIDGEKGELMLQVQDEQVTFNVFKAMKHSSDASEGFMLDEVQQAPCEIVDDETGLLKRVIPKPLKPFPNHRSKKEKAKVGHLEARKPKEKGEAKKELYSAEKGQDPSQHLKKGGGEIDRQESSINSREP